MEATVTTVTVLCVFYMPHAAARCLSAVGAKLSTQHAQLYAYAPAVHAS
jgi:hypothetical protein